MSSGNNYHIVLLPLYKIGYGSAISSKLDCTHLSLSLYKIEYAMDRQETKLNINQWAEEDRPREKLMRLGATALTNAELLAILIGSGSTQESAVDLMKRVLNDCNNNLNTLGKMTIGELASGRYKGLGPAKAVAVIAACELGKRRQAEKAEERKSLDSAEAIYNFMRPKMQDLSEEEAWILLMSHNCKLIKAVQLSHGGITETAVDIRLIIKNALLCNATVIALCHNHPSNNPHPGREDDLITRRLKNACELMRLHLIDHLVITDGRYYSYNEEGRL